MSAKHGFLIHARSEPGVLHELTGVIAAHQGNIASVTIVEEGPPEARVYFEIELPGAPQPLLEDLRALPVVRDANLVETLQKIYGKRIIVVGGGAQVVTGGAVAEIRRRDERDLAERSSRLEVIACLARRFQCEVVVAASSERIMPNSPTVVSPLLRVAQWAMLSSKQARASPTAEQAALQLP